MKSLNSEVHIETNSVATLFVGLCAAHTREHASAVFATDKSNSSRSGFFPNAKSHHSQLRPYRSSRSIHFWLCAFNQTTNSLSVGFAGVGCLIIGSGRPAIIREPFFTHYRRSISRRVLHTTCPELQRIQGSLHLAKVELNPMSRLLIPASQDLLGGLYA